MRSDTMIERRTFLRTLACGASLLPAARAVAARNSFELDYIVASSMYGRMKLERILPEVPKTGAKYIDIWPEKHADQREQIEAMEHARFVRLLEDNGVRLGILTHYDLGPFGLQDEMKVTRELGGKMVIAGGSGPKGLQGAELKTAVKQFIEKMKPHIKAAEDAGITIGIENHANNLIESPDSMRWLAEFAPSPHIGVALAPYHLPQDPDALARLIEDLGDGLVHFYAWQHGMGCHKKRLKEHELLQMPSRGPLDFKPLLTALDKIGYKGWTEIFMHPVPRGIPILPTAAEVTAEINRSREYLEGCLEQLRTDSKTSS